LLSSISLEDLEALKKDIAGGKTHPMDAKRGLAREIVTRFHSEKIAGEAEEQFNMRFSDRKSLEDMADDESVEAYEMAEPLPLFKVVAQVRGVSSSEAIRMIKGGAVRIMDDKVDDTQYLVTPGQDKVIRVGKKFFRVLKG
ncbi:tyrosine--tRNA ligase, partial [bacterium]|nr:tyrosine--tRNA ligase [bacterium]